MESSQKSSMSSGTDADRPRPAGHGRRGGRRTVLKTLGGAALASPMDVQPSYPEPAYPQASYPPMEESVGPVPEELYWPRRLPPADVPMSYTE